MIGVFDSGFGGLTILKEFIKNGAPLAEYDYVYLGDNARAPYGDKSPEIIYEYTKQALDFLFKQGCELIIIGCNTSSVDALRKIQREYLPNNYPGKRVLGVIVPLVEATADILKNNKPRPKSAQSRVGVIGTRHTIQSGVYEEELKKLAVDFEIYGAACPLLVPLIEENWTKRRETKMILRKYLRPLATKKIQILILGCTHYPVLIKEIEGIMGKSVKVINAPQVVADKLNDYLIKHPEIESKLSQNKQRKYYTTDDAGRFRDFGKKFLGQCPAKVERIELKSATVPL